MKLIIARHGETVGNSHGRYMGQNDSPLTEKGMRQARSLAEELRDEKIDFLYSSPLGRAFKTAQEINKFHNLGIIVKDALKEITYGEFEGKSLKEIEKTHPEWKVARKADRYYAKPPGGESYVELEARLGPVLDEILSKKGTVLVVGHANVNKAIIRMTLGLDKSEVSGFSQPNNCIYYIEGKGGRYTLRHRLLAQEEEGCFRNE